ncbi:MAG: dihydrodipicolinate synthase family protein [Planctomycetaceae bacterium]|nr:dihydrodipicolinate synthase family protein [Planctomycetaceae bacterium]
MSPFTMHQPLLPLKGIIPPLITPLSDRDRIDGEGLRRLIEHVLAGGIHGLFLLGTSGEAPSLSHELQREFLKLACEIIDHRVVVLAGITDTAMTETLDFAEFALDVGVDGLVLAAPYYFPMHQLDLERYIRELAQELPLPFLLYNMPSHTKVDFGIDTVMALLDLTNFVGVKDSSGNMHYFNKLIQLTHERPDFSVLIGPEELLAEAVLMGANGGISGGANLVPNLYVDLYDAALTGDLRDVQRLQQQLMRLSRLLYEVGTPPTGYLTGIKTALELAGLCSGRLAEPLYAMPKERRQKIQQHMQDLGIFEMIVSSNN